MSLNKVMLIGNVGRDPEVRYLEGTAGAANATKVASFTLATTERYRDRSGELRENTEWHNIVAWRNSADLAEKFIRRGSQVYIEGRLRTRSWTDPQGVKKYTTEIIVDNIQLLGKRTDNPAEQAQGGFQQPQAQGYTAQAPSASPAPAQNVAPAYRQPASSVPAGFQPRTETAAAPLDIMGDGSDDLPF